MNNFALGFAQALRAGDVGGMHMLRLAAICWAIWKPRSMICFENKLIQNPRGGGGWWNAYARACCHMLGYMETKEHGLFWEQTN
jgi:hypothetical protein